MKRLSPKLVQAFEREMDRVEIPAGEWSDYFKWLRYFLDFCAKYSHPPRDSDSLPEFLQKLASKNQTPELQTQAASSVNLFYELMMKWKLPPVQADGPQADAGGWKRCQKKLEDEIRLRQYSDKTLKTYYKIRRIQEMLGNSDVRTTMIHTHTVQSRTLKERESPLDFTGEQMKKRKCNPRKLKPKAPFKEQPSHLRSV